MSDNNKNVAVIGAGIVGVSTAIWLQRAGFKVILIDREGVAAGTSYGMPVSWLVQQLFL